MREAALRALRALLDSLSESASVDVRTSRGHLASFTLPPPPPPPPEPVPRDDDERDCRADVLAVLRDAGRRLTTTQILAELARRGWHHGERTVQRRLAELVADGTLTNDPRGRPPGYAVAVP